MTFSTPLIRCAAVFSVTLLAACGSIKPQPFQASEVRATAVSDVARARAEYPPLAGPLTLHEAIARALKYNLDHRTRLMEQSYALGQLDVAKFDLLPRLGVGVDHIERDKYYIANAINANTGAPSLTNYISSDKSHTLTDIGLTWNVLDFGLSYYNAKQQADRVLMASERRRKAMHQLIQAVEAAYWKAMSAQKLHAQVQDAILQAEDALAKSGVLEKESIKAPAEALRYQRALLENLRTLEGVEQELSLARIELAGLINLPPGQPYRLSEAEDESALPELKVSLERLEEIAIANNADLREQNYNTRIAAVESRKALLKIFPGLSFGYDYKHDDDRFLVNHRWQEAGLHLSWNLLNILSAPAQMDLADKGEKLAETRRMALSMALITQVHIAVAQYEGARHQFERAHRIWVVDDRMMAIASAGKEAETESRLHQIASRTASILSLLRRYQALSNLHAAMGKIEATLGLEPPIGSVDEMPLADLSQTVKTALGDWQQFKLPAEPQEAQP